MDICEMRCHSTEDISKLKYKLIECCESCIESAGGIETIRADVLERYVELIEDLSKAEMNSIRACYYQTVIDAMKSEDHESSIGRMHAGVQTEELDSVYPKTMTN
jgi:hypothetical protein